MLSTNCTILHDTPTYSVYEFTLDAEYGFHTFATTAYRWLNKGARRELHTLGKSELVLTRTLRVVVASGRSVVTAVSGDKMLPIFEGLQRSPEDAVALAASKLASDDEVNALRAKMAEKAAKAAR